MSHYNLVIHVILSLITFGVLVIAGIQASLYIVQERRVRFQHRHPLLSLPPLETMERVLFRTIGIGIAFLTLLIVTSLFAFFARLLHITVLSKAILACVTWLTFVIMWSGHHYLGWRGQRVARATLVSVSLLILVGYLS